MNEKEQPQNWESVEELIKIINAEIKVIYGEMMALEKQQYQKAEIMTAIYSKLGVRQNLIAFFVSCKLQEETNKLVEQTDKLIQVANAQKILAEAAGTQTNKLINLTCGIIAVSVALLVFAIVQTAVMFKQDAATHPQAEQTSQHR